MSPRVTSPSGLVRLLCLAVVPGVAVLSACTRDGATNVEHGSRHQVLHFGNGDEPREIDPHVVTGIPEWHIIMALYEGLVSKDPADLAIRPGVAERWDISADQKTYTFHLRHDARWSNGDPVTAHDFVYSFRRALMPALGNLYAYMFFGIRNAEGFFTGAIDDFSAVGVQALDDRTLQVELNHPIPYFLQLLDHHSFYPVNPRVIGKFGAIDERGTRWTRPGNFVGNGAFVLDQWQLNRILTVKKNPLYWDSRSVRLQEIHFYPIANRTTEERMFRAGQLHITDRVPTEKIAVYRRTSPAGLSITAYLGNYFYRMNTAVPPLDDARVRRALSMSIDRRQIVEKIMKGGQLPAWALTPPVTAGYTTTARVGGDIDTARGLLAAAGYPDGRGFPELELMFNTDEAHRQIATAIQQMWKKALNIRITLLTQDWQVFQDREANGQYQLSRGSWIGDYVDPTTFLELFLGDSGNNRTGWRNQDYDQLLAKAARASNQAERHGLLDQAERLLIDDSPIIPIYYYTQVRLVSPDVRGWAANILDQHPYKYLWLEPAAPSGAAVR